MQRKLLIFETHPIQYRAPVFQALAQLRPESFEAVYASDFSVRGYKDAQFGTTVAWDTPLLAGYPHRVLHNEVGKGIESWGGLTGRGVDALIADVRPAAVLLHSFGYAFTMSAYWAALRRQIPIWIRMETQDHASPPRGPLKTAVRTAIYRVLYRSVSKAFYIGQLNREHYLRHGMKPNQLVQAHYCTPDPIAQLSSESCHELRCSTRQAHGIANDAVVISFFGKLITKKDPVMLVHAVAAMRLPPGRPLALLFVGNGELESELQELTRKLLAPKGIQVVFAGFINQSKLAGYYLASDVVALPSRRMGETWGLVVNEALQAGCAVVVSDAVGCQRDFGTWDRVRVVPVEDCAAAALALGELALLPRDFNWARPGLESYSIQAAAAAISSEMDKLPSPSA